MLPARPAAGAAEGMTGAPGGVSGGVLPSPRRMPLQLGRVRNALAALRAVQVKSEVAVFMASLDAMARAAIRSGVIQHFDIAAGRAGNFMRRRPETDIGRTRVNGIPRCARFRIAVEDGPIDTARARFQYHRVPNRTSHTHDPPIAASVHTGSLALTQDAGTPLARLEARNA